jgi:hypothetical protein
VARKAPAPHRSPYSTAPYSTEAALPAHYSRQASSQGRAAVNNNAVAAGVSSRRASRHSAPFGRDDQMDQKPGRNAPSGYTPASSCPWDRDDVQQPAKHSSGRKQCGLPLCSSAGTSKCITFVLTYPSQNAGRPC